MHEHHVIFLSPCGSTRAAAWTVAGELARLGAACRTTDLSPILRGQAALPAFPPGACLWIGSPVYCDHALPQVMDCITGLPPGEGRFAVPFVTWGGVCSGTALAEMGRALARKGYALLGAAKVMAEHSSLWRYPEPIGKGRPDEADLKLLRELAASVLARSAGLETGQGGPLDPAALDYQPERNKAKAVASSLAAAKRHAASLDADEARCISCELCVDICPVGARRMDPLPVAGETCILCKSCARCCPEGAINADTTGFLERLRAVSEECGEARETRIFL